MALLTGEQRSMHVDAETDMELFSLSRAKFEILSSENLELRNFLTEVLTERLSTVKLTASRNIGKYVIKEVIGRGGWSIVYGGVHKRLNFPVAIKMLKHTMAMDKDFLGKFQNEAYTIAQLNHPNIVKVYDIEELYRTVFIMMEYLEGFSLEYILENMPKLPLSTTLDIIVQICIGLEYAHRKGIIHQDIKPANIFILKDNSTKIVDFGLACPRGNIDFDLPGTVFYMAPEQIQGDPVDERTDIYSLGITVYEILTGKRPFPEDDLSKIMDYHMKEDAPDVRSITPDIPDELHAFLSMSIRRDPDQRIKSISEVIQLLQPLAKKIGLQYKRQHQREKRMMNLFLSYPDDQHLAINRMIDQFSNDISEMGAKIQITGVEDI
jgi:serine/threonine protein kinase